MYKHSIVSSFLTIGLLLGSIANVSAQEQTQPDMTQMMQDMMQGKLPNTQQPAFPQMSDAAHTNPMMNPMMMAPPMGSAMTNPMTGSMANPMMGMMNPMLMMNPMMMGMPMMGGTGHPMLGMMNPPNWVNPNTYTQFMSPNAYQTMMNPMSYMTFMNPGTYQALMNPYSYMQFMNPSTYGPMLNPQTYIQMMSQILGMAHATDQQTAEGFWQKWMELGQNQSNN